MKNEIKTLTLAVGFIAGMCMSSLAAIVVTTSEDFTGAGAVPAGYTFTDSGGYLTNDPDGGDGVGDGAIFVNGNGGAPLSTVTFELGEVATGHYSYTFSANFIPIKYVICSNGCGSAY